MSITLRILLLFAAIITAVWILHKIRKSKVRMESSIYWILFAGILLVLGLFPEISYRLGVIFGIQSPANLIFLVIIFLLMEKVFTLSIVVSQLEEKVSVLSTEIALRFHSAERRLNEHGEEEKKDSADKETKTEIKN